MLKDFWAFIPNYSKYLINSKGDIYSVFSKKILKTYNTNSSKYNEVRLVNDNGKIYNIYPHQLVAKLFCKNKNPFYFNCVDHIDKNKLNNNYTNLRYVNHKLNIDNKYNRHDYNDKGFIFNDKFYFN